MNAKIQALTPIWDFWSLMGMQRDGTQAQLVLVKVRALDCGFAKERESQGPEWA